MSSSSPDRQWLRLEDPQAVHALLKPQSSRYLQPFFGRELAISEAASQLGVRIDTLVYQVERLMSLGLLTITGVADKRGRPRARYRAVADAFIIPFASTHADAVLELFLLQDQAQRLKLAAGLLKQQPCQDWQLCIYQHEDNGALIREIMPVGQPEQAPQWYSTLQLRLTKTEALALQRDLALLQQHYLSKHEPQGAQCYTLQLGFSGISGP